MSAKSYEVTIVSFDDDFYYGTFYRKDEESRRHHLFTMQLDLDDCCERVMPDTSTFVDMQTYVDFEIDPLDSDRRHLLADKISDVLKKKAREIYQVVKVHGAIGTWVILDGESR